MTMSKKSQNLVNKLSAVKLLVSDVDGVLTNGSIIYDETGNETKQFNVSDGLGIVLLSLAGISTVWITGRASNSVIRRAEELKVAQCMVGIRDKAAALSSLCQLMEIDLSEILYIGDDWNDIPAIRLAGLSAAPQNAAEEVLHMVDWQLQLKGGEGVLRTVCKAILDAQGKTAEVMELYLQSLKHTSSPIH